MVGQSLANGLRRGDIPVRRGGEEFLALLPGADQAGLNTTAERVRMLVENSWIQKGEAQARVTVSVGATMAAPDETADDLVDRADGFMYASKQGGCNRVTTDIGELTGAAEAPILGTTIPWEMPVIAPDPKPSCSRRGDWGRRPSRRRSSRATSGTVSLRRPPPRSKVWAWTR